MSLRNEKVGQPRKRSSMFCSFLLRRIGIYADAGLGLTYISLCTITPAMKTKTLNKTKYATATGISFWTAYRASRFGFPYLTVSHILPLSNPESIGYRYLTEFWLGQSDRWILPWIQLAGLRRFYRVFISLIISS